MKMTHNFPRLERKDIEGGDADVTNALARLGQTVETKTAEIKTALEQKYDGELAGLRSEIAALKRPGAGGDGETKEAKELEAKAFWGFVRGGVESLGPDERKSLIVGDDTKGGFLAPDQFVAEIQRELVEISPIRAAARVGPTSAGAVILPKRTGRMTAKWVGETEERQKTEPTYGQAEIEVHEMAAYVDVSQRLLEDSAVDLAAELAFDFAEEFGRLEGEAFVVGNGAKKPLGILAAPGIQHELNGHATNIAPDKLIALMYGLPAYYRNRGVWLMNGETLGKIRTLKDGQNNYLWQKSFTEGQPDTLLGRPVIEAPDMPGAAAGEFPIAYGDIASAYRIFDRVGLSILRDPYTVATEGLVRFHGRKRVGGSVTRPDAIRKLKMA